MSKLWSVTQFRDVQHSICIMTHSDMFSPDKAFPGAKHVKVSIQYRQIQFALGRAYWLVYFLRLKNCNRLYSIL